MDFYLSSERPHYHFLEKELTIENIYHLKKVKKMHSQIKFLETVKK